MENVLYSLFTWFRENVTIIETFHKTKDLKIYELISDLQDIEIYHLLKKYTSNKRKSLALKSTKIRSSKEKVTSMAFDNSS